MVKPFFSILIPVCNQVGKMDRCVETLRGQTFPDFEVICVDDGSTDGSWAMLQGFQQADGRFRSLRHEKNGSLVAARITGMKEARGEYVLFVDSDDYVEKDMLEILHRKLTEHPVDILRFGFAMEPDWGDKPPLVTDDPFLAFLESRETAAIWKRAYSGRLIRRALEKISPFYCNMGEDTFFSSVFFSLAESVDQTEEILYHYETGGMSSVGKRISKEKLARDLASAAASAKHTLAFLEANNPGYLAPARRAVRFISRYIVWLAINAEPELDGVVEMLFQIPRDEGDDDLFRFACRKLLYYKVEKLVTNNACTKSVEEFMAFLSEDLDNSSQG